MSENQVVSEAPQKTAFERFGEKVNAIPLWGKILIVVGCCLLDTVTCVLLLVGSVVFMKSGNKGLAIVLACCNILIPDALPFVDEIFTVIVTVIPLYKEYKATGSIFKAVKAGVESHQDYKGLSDTAVNEGILSVALDNDSDVDVDVDDDEYVEDYNEPKQGLITESSDVTSTIKELNQMKNDRIITEEEFAQKKSELLSKL